MQATLSAAKAQAKRVFHGQKQEVCPAQVQGPELREMGRENPLPLDRHQEQHKVQGPLPTP